LSNYLIFGKQFIIYIVILYKHNSFTEIKNFHWSWPLKTAWQQWIIITMMLLPTTQA